MKALSRWLRKISTTWMMAGTLLLMVSFMIFVLPGQASAADQVSGEAQSPDLSFFYTPKQLVQMASEYGSAGRQAYIRTRWTFDLVFPLVYSAFLTVGISWFINRLDGFSGFWLHTNLLPVLAGLFDLLENTGTSMSMALYPTQVPGWLFLASISTPIKWSYLTGSFILYFGLAAIFLFRKLKNPRS